MNRVAFLICVAFINSPVNCEIRRSYRVQEVHHFNEVEPAPKAVIPGRDGNSGHIFSNPFTQDREKSSSYVGWLFAGRTEFNWLVKLTAQSLSTNHDAIGNLFSTFHVLTTCSFLVAPDKRPSITGPVTIRYATLYLNDDNKYYYFDVNAVKNKLTNQLPPETGIRKAEKNGIYIHPECFGDYTHIDAAIITMDRELKPWSPIITFLPSVVDVTTRPKIAPLIELADLQQATLFENSLKCYVASFGKPYQNWGNNYVQNYKVKYRAYPQNWAYCKHKFREYLCSNQDDPRKCKIFRDSHKDHVCFTTRARTGSVCYDFDRGAPLVCNGLVYGIVTNGAKTEYCSSRIQLPFVVMKITALTEFMKKAFDKDINLLKPDKQEMKYGKNFTRRNYITNELSFILAISCIFIKR